MSLLDKDELSHVASVDLIMENCDFITIPYKYINNFSLREIYDNYIKCATGIWKHKAAKGFYIEIKKQFNTVKHRSDFEQSCSDNKNDEKPELPFETLTRVPDITNIMLHYEDGSTSEEVSVPWNNDEYVNEKQTYDFTKNGDLGICISEKYKIKDILGDDKN